MSLNMVNIFNIKYKKPFHILMSYLPKVCRLEMAKNSKRLQNALKIREVIYQIYSLKISGAQMSYNLKDFGDEEAEKEILNSLFDISFLPFFNGIGFTLNGHSKRINKINILPSFPLLENAIVSFGMDNIINIWDLRKKVKFAEFYPFTHEDMIIAVLPYYVKPEPPKIIKDSLDKKEKEPIDTKEHHYILSISWDKLIHKIDLDTQKIIEIHQLQQFDKLKDAIIFNNEYLVTSGYDKEIVVWSLKDKFKRIIHLKGHTSTINKLVDLKNGKMASGSWDYTIRIWNMNTFECEQIITEIQSKTEDLILLQDGRLCALGSDGYVRVLSQNYKGIDFKFTGLDFICQLRDGRIATGLGENVFHFVNIYTKKEELIYKTKHSDSIRHLQQIPDGRIITCSDDKSIIVHGFVTKLELAEDAEKFIYEYNDGCLSIIYNEQNMQTEQTEPNGI
ncbi:MAG: hypothetical protein MJ252_08515 [archaeon]|nr:hypothetical protein [archaeon]